MRSPDHLLDTYLREGRAFLTMPSIVRDRIRFVMRKPALGHCWEVRGGWNSGNGYAKCRHAGRAWMAHRLAFVFAWGHVERQHLLDHLCENRACVRPTHLEPVTAQVNTQRGKAILFRKA